MRLEFMEFRATYRTDLLSLSDLQPSHQNQGPIGGFVFREPASPPFRPKWVTTDRSDC